MIIPTFNRAPLLARAMTSVLTQQVAPSELIVVDDGSSDETASLVARLAARAPLPIRYLHQANRGAAAARNLGIGAAQGSLIAFLDSDDWWLPHKLAVQSAALAAQPRYRISHSRELWFRDGQRFNQKKRHDPPDGAVFFASLGCCLIGMSTILARRTLFDCHGLFDENLPCCEDYDFWLRVGCREPFLRVAEALTCKEGGRPDQLSAQHRLGMDRFRIQSLVKLMAGNDLDRDQRRGAATQLVHLCTLYGRGCLKHGHTQEGARYLALADWYQPLLEPAA